jgi:hypothetical protein
LLHAAASSASWVCSRCKGREKWVPSLRESCATNGRCANRFNRHDRYDRTCAGCTEEVAKQPTWPKHPSPRNDSARRASA